MIGWSGTGKSFSGLSKYLEQDEKMDWKEVQNLASDKPGEYLERMKETASLSRAEKPVYHLSISYDKGDQVTKKQMLEDGKKVLEKLGLEEHQAVFVGHKDADHPHMHMMVNRVDPVKEKAFNPWQDQKKIEPALREIENDRGYRKTPGLNSGLDRREYKKELQLSKDERDMMRRYAEGDPKALPMKAKAQMMGLDDAFKSARNWDELEEALDSVDMKIKRRGRGAVLQDKNNPKSVMKLSDIGTSREHSFGKLEKRFGSHKQYEKNKELLKSFEKDVSEKISYNSRLKDTLTKQAKDQLLKNKPLDKAGKEAFKKGIKQAVGTANKAKSVAKAVNKIAMANPAVAGIGIAKKVVSGLAKQAQSKEREGPSLGLSM